MFVSDFVSHCSSDNKDEEPIPYFTDTSCLDNVSYMSYLDTMCNFNYKTNQGICTKHSFPSTRSQAKLQKIILQSTVSSSKQRPPSLLRDLPAVIAGKRSIAPPPADLGTTAPKKRGHSRPPLHRVEQTHPFIHTKEPDVIEDINETLPTMFPVRKRLRNRQPVQPAQPLIVQPNVPLPYDEDHTAIKQIQT